MARMTVNQIAIEYALHGPPHRQAIALTPGGRFGMTTPGMAEMAEALVAAGYRVLLWDRPNCGHSDLCLEGDNEAVLQADCLAALVRALDLGPTVYGGGSAGSRVSLIAGVRHPETCAAQLQWWISGEPIALAQLATVYCGEAAQLASSAGMAAVPGALAWRELCETNPTAREQLLAIDPARFIAVMQRWAAAYFPAPGSPVPGLSQADYARLTMPTLIFRSSHADLSHPRTAGEQVHALIPGSKLVDPPWPETEWNDRAAALANGSARGLFIRWPMLVPQIVEFLRENGL